MGRGHLAGALVAAVVGAFALGAPAPALARTASSAVLRWSVVAQGKTEPRGQEPVGYVARSRAGAQAWLGRLTSADRTVLARLDYRRNAAVAVILDGFPCASALRVTGFSADRRRVFVSLKRPRIGIATCVRRSISYVVVELPKAALQHAPGSRIRVVVHARS